MYGSHMFCFDGVFHVQTFMGFAGFVFVSLCLQCFVLCSCLVDPSVFISQSTPCLHAFVQMVDSN